MFWDDLVRRWRRDVRRLNPRLLRATAGHVAVLPAPKPRRRRWILLLVIALAIAVLALLLQSGQVEAILIGRLG